MLIGLLKISVTNATVANATLDAVLSVFMNN